MRKQHISKKNRRLRAKNERLKREATKAADEATKAADEATKAADEAKRLADNQQLIADSQREIERQQQKADRRQHASHTEDRMNQRLRWMQQADDQVKQQEFDTLLSPNHKVTPNRGYVIEYNVHNPAPQADYVGTSLETATSVGMAVFLSSLASKKATKYVMEPSAHKHHFHAMHFAAMSYVGVMMIGSWAYNSYRVARSPNVNQHQAVSLGIQTGIATTIGTTVFGGFAKKALAAAGPIGFFVVNLTLFAKAAHSAYNNHKQMRILAKSGKQHTLAYQTYRRKRNQYMVQSALHAVGAAGTAILITFAPVIALGWTITTAAASAVAQLVPLGIKLFKKWTGKKEAKPKQEAAQVEQSVDRNSDTHVLQGASSTHNIQPLQASDRVIRSHVDHVKDWEKAHESAHKTIRKYDRRPHYRHAMFHQVQDGQVVQAAVARCPDKLRYRVLAIAERSKHMYVDRMDGIRKRKYNLSESLVNLIKSGDISVDKVHQAVKENAGKFYQRGALSSFNRRVGYMQSVVEAVEYYAAWVDADHDVNKIDHERLQFQHSDDYLIHAECLQKDHVEAAVLESKDESEYKNEDLSEQPMQTAVGMHY